MERSGANQSSLSGRAYLTTEQANPRSHDLDRLEGEAFVELFCDEEARVVPAVRAAAPAIARAIERIALALGSGGRLYYVGAGTSGRLAVLDASECPPTFCSDPSLVQGLIAGGPDALVRSVEGAEDDPETAGAELDRRGLRPQDVVVGITAGGTTPYVLGALAHARIVGCGTVFVACVPASQVEEQWDIEIRVPVGPEILTGSTRLKAGTATKLVLNLLSTGAMVRLGKTYGNLMVDVAVTNTKLLDRATRIVMGVTRLERSAAAALLEAADFRVKIALLMHWSGQDRFTCSLALDAASGQLARARNQLVPQGEGTGPPR